jgi:hypothetical protein
MLKKETIIAMATALKMDVAAVTAAYDDAEAKDVTITPELIVLTKAEQTSREEQLKRTHETAGFEIAVKTLKTDAGVEFDGKDGKKLIEAIKAKTLADAKIEESTKVKELNTTIEGLRTNISTLTTEKESFVKTTKEAQLDSDILSWTIDKKPDHLTNKEWLAMIKLNNEIAEDNGVMVVKREGKVVVNATDLKPIVAKDALVSYIDERKWGKVVEGAAAAAGRGAGDSKTGLLGIGNMKQFNDHIAAQGISANGEQAQKMLAEITTANANFDFATK